LPIDRVKNRGFDYGNNKSPTTKSVIAHHQISYNKTPRFLNQNKEERDQRDCNDRSLLLYTQREREREREREVWELNEKIKGKGKKREVSDVLFVREAIKIKIKKKNSIRKQYNATFCSLVEEKSSLHFKNIIQWSDVFKVLLTHSSLKVEIANLFGML
jgi:tRNA U54 and U55 pseudouridine synthase Pus10